MATTLRGTADLYIVLPLIIVFIRLIYRLVSEKEKKIREGMKMMGMSQTSFYLSYIITYMIIYFILTVIVTSLLVGGVLKNCNWLAMFVILYLFDIVLIF